MGNGKGGIDPSHPVTVQNPPNVVAHQKPSELYNSYTQNNFTVINQKKASFNYSQGASDRLRGNEDRFRQAYGPGIQQRVNGYQNYYRDNAFRYGCSSYFAYGFCGGYYYPVLPWVEFEAYFYYPIISWLYVDATLFDVTFYEEWYGVDYPTYPVTPFSFAGVFFPTETLRDLAIDVNGMSVQNQYNFRAALETALGYLTDEVSDVLQASFQLGDNDVVVTHYENLNNQAVVMEGFVDRGDIHLPFKAVLDLVNNTQTAVFVPDSQTMNADDLARLQVVNDIITSFGGNPDVVQGEPDPAPAPTPGN